MLHKHNKGTMVPNKSKIYTVSLEDTRNVDDKEINYEYSMAHHHRRSSNASESLKLELSNFLKDFTFSDDILHKRREWL